MFYLYACMGTVCMQCWQRAAEGVRSPETRVTESCAPPCRCWEPNLGPLQELQMLLTAEPSPAPLDSLLSECLYCYCCHRWLPSDSTGLPKELNTSDSSGVLQAFSTCLELLKHTVFGTEQLPGSVPFQYTDSHCWAATFRSCQPIQ